VGFELVVKSEGVMDAESGELAEKICVMCKMKIELRLSS